MAANELFAGNDATLTATGLRNAATSAYLNSATVTAQLYDEDDAAVGSAVALAYTAASDGDYAGVIESSVIDAGFDVGDFYRLEVTTVQGGVDAQFNITGTVGRRGTG